MKNESFFISDHCLCEPMDWVTDLAWTPVITVVFNSPTLHAAQSELNPKT